MYDITYQGRTLRLNDRDYKQLERRFDPKRYRRSKDRSYFYNYSVCICSSYNGCSKCPFKQAPISCVEILLSSSRLLPRDVSPTYRTVYLYADNLDGIKRVHDVLLTATKVSTH